MSICTMLVNNLEMDLRIAPKLEKVENASGEEVAQGLPSGEITDVYAVDEYPGCPDNWMNGSNVASSYFLGVKEEKGMWLNFNTCTSHKHDVAVVVSVQGINPVTGQKMVGENPLRLEKYYSKCPIHDIDFKQDRFCEECGYKWPAQNYIATTATPWGLFWLDGFRNSDGVVRQYIFTEEEIKGVASQMIGDDRVFAIGVAFYLSKEPKAVPEPRGLMRRKGGGQSMGMTGFAGTLCGGSCISLSASSKKTRNSVCSAGDMLESVSFQADSVDDEPTAGGLCLPQGINLPDAAPTPVEETLGDIIIPNNYDCADIQVMSEEEGRAKRPEMYAEESVEPVTPVKKLEVGAGAMISQKIYVDTKEMDHWEEKPVGMIYINYCDKETLKNILAKGRRKEKKEGFMEGLKVGS